MSPRSQSPWALGLLSVAIVLFVNAPLLDDFSRLIRTSELASVAEDAPTHFFRVSQARDLYLPSGHRLGWEPYWYQGYVPFLLYPHLPYVALALVSLVVPIELARLFNLSTIVAYVALPIVVAMVVGRSSGWLAAALVASWLGVLSTFGAGLKGVFEIGLLNQQVGVLVFALFVHDLLVARRTDRAAIWLGLLPLVHVHSSLVAGVAWLVAGLLASVARSPFAFRLWLKGSVVALFVAAPFVLGLVQGWEQIGRPTFYGRIENLWERMATGGMFAPWPTVLAIVLCAVAGARSGPAEQRRSSAIFALVGVVLLAVSVRPWSVGWRFVDDLSASMLYLRTLPFAFVWLAMLALGVWRHVPRSVRLAAAALSLLGVFHAWGTQSIVAPLIGTSRSAVSSISATLADFEMILEWIDAEAGDETATVSISSPTSRSFALSSAVRRLELPLLEGHGEELTSVHNADLVDRFHDMPCDGVRTAIRHHAIGYLVGTDANLRNHLDECLRPRASAQRGEWWVLATGRSWSNTPLIASAFAHDSTWTELRWTLRRSAGDTSARLPVAHTAPWVADVDGHPVTIETTSDGMMKVLVPRGAGSLTLRYEGYSGEWAVVIVSMLALLFGIRRASSREAPATGEPELPGSQRVAQRQAPTRRPLNGLENGISKPPIA